MSNLIARPAVVRQAIERTKKLIHHLRRTKGTTWSRVQNDSNSALVEQEEAILRKLESVLGGES